MQDEAVDIPNKQLRDTQAEEGPDVVPTGALQESSIDDSILGPFNDVAMMAADWFWEMDSELRFSYQSARFEEITGIPASEVLGKTREQAFAGRIDDSDKWARIGLALKEQRDYSMVWAIKHKDGKLRVLRTRGKPIQDEFGEFAGYRGVGSDITEAVFARDQLIASEARFRNILEHVTDIVCVISHGGQLKFLNNSVESILGYSVAELEALPAADLELSEESDRIARDMKEACEHPGCVIKGKYHYQHKNGSIRILEMTRKCIPSDSENDELDMVVHARDITDQFHAELALKHSEERLRDFAETSADWFWEQDSNFRFTYVSGHFPGGNTGSDISKSLGLTRQEFLIGQNFSNENWQYLFDLQARREPYDNFEYTYHHPNGSVIVVRINGRPVYDDKGEFSGYRGTGIDITDAHALSEQLNYQATHDPLTGLINRREFEQRLGRVVKGCREQGGESALCYIDLDQFKVVNDTCGHDAGDELLRQLAALLRHKARSRDTIARLGGDEFGLLLEACSLAQANRAAETIRKAIEDFRFIWAGRNFRLGASIGLIPIDFRSGNVANVMRSADAACYAAKDAGRNRIHVYSDDNIEVLQRHEEMQKIVDFNSAFDEQRFVLHRQLIQPLVPKNDGGDLYYEVLVRMLDESGGLVMPGNFLPAAERYNLITQLDGWVVESTLDWLVANPEVRCSINLSGMSIADENFLSRVLQLLDSKPVQENRICFEITETAVIQNMSRANTFIARLRERGCYFALDDFGSGLSSFAYLKSLPVDLLKIDGFFVRDMLKERVNYELVKSINEIGHVMGMGTIAEFIEDEETLEALKKMGVDYAQGYAIGRPEAIDN